MFLTTCIDFIDCITRHPSTEDIRNLYSLSLSMNHSFEYRMQKTNMSCCYNGLINKVMYPSSMLRRFVSSLLMIIRIPLWYSPDEILWRIFILRIVSYIFIWEFKLVGLMIWTAIYISTIRSNATLRQFYCRWNTMMLAHKFLHSVNATLIALYADNRDYILKFFLM